MVARLYRSPSSGARTLGFIVVYMAACDARVELGDVTAGPVDGAPAAEVTLPDAGSRDTVALPDTAPPDDTALPADTAASDAVASSDTTGPAEVGPSDTSASDDTGRNPCDPNPCTTPPEACQGDTLTRYGSPGGCTPDGAEARCAYPVLGVTDCAATGQVCAAARDACVPPDLALTTVVPTPDAPAPTDAAIRLTFNLALDPATVTAQTEAGPCSGGLQLSRDDFATCIAFDAALAALSDGGRVATLKPAGALTGGLVHAIRVTTAIAAAAGGRLPAPATRTFTTAEARVCGSAGGSAVVISQVYGGGGNAGAPYKHDYVELRNRASVPVALDGWSLQYAAAEGDGWSNSTNVPVTLTGIIPAGGHFLVQLVSSGAVGADLPAADQTGRINLANASGKVALVKGTLALPRATCPAADRLIDLVAYGASATLCGTSGRTANLTAAQAAHRDVAGCVDDDAADRDFALGAPAPRNATTPPVFCACPDAPVRNGTSAAVEACSLVRPAATGAAAGAVAGPIVGRVFQPGVTDASPEAAASGLMGQLGLGREGTDPRDQTGWAWLPGRFASEAGAGRDDTWEATLPVPYAQKDTVYRHTWRFSRDEVASWTYCDLSGAGASADAFDPDDLGRLIIGGSPCEPNPCTQPPAMRGCDGERVSGWEAVGTCELIDEAASCAYAPRVTEDCAARGAFCEAGACVECRTDGHCDAPFERCADQACVAACSDDDLAGNALAEAAVVLPEASAELRDLVLCPGIRADFFRLPVAAGASVQVLVAHDASRGEVGLFLSRASRPDVPLAVGAEVVGGLLATWTAPEATEVLIEVRDLAGLGNTYDLTVSASADPCAPNPCQRPGDAFCVGEVLVTPAGLGRCKASPEPFSCDYLAEAGRVPCDFGCEARASGPDACASPPPFAVVATSPADSATEIPSDAPITITFNQPIDGATVITAGADGACSGNVQLSHGAFAGTTCLGVAPVSGLSLSDDRRTLRLEPVSPLPLGVPLALRIGTGLRSAAGTALAADVTVGFRTAAPIRCGGGLVVLSQVFGGGGNNGAPYQNDFVELHNRGTAAVSLRGWTLQYGSTSGTSWQVMTLTGLIPPGGFHLVQLAAGAGTSAALPAPDATGTFNVASTGGRLALVAGGTALAAGCPTEDARVVDLVGWGGATCFEGASAGTPTANTTALHRDVGGCLDAGQGGTDFLVATPTPRNAATAPVQCGCRSEARNGAGAPSEVAACTLLGSSPLWVEPGATSAPVPAELHHPGVTDVLTGGPAPGVRAEIGFGGLPESPDGEAVWAFASASFVAESGPSRLGETWQAAITAPPAARGVTYRVAARFSVDGGANWTWCDRDGAGAATEGFSDDALGELRLGPDLCAPNPCTRPPEGLACDGDVVTAATNPGVCKTDGAFFTCGYGLRTPVTDCARAGQHCVSGACVACRDGSHCASGVCNPDGTCKPPSGPCEPNPCQREPEAICVERILLSESATGTCVAAPERPDGYQCDWGDLVETECAAFCVDGAVVNTDGSGQAACTDWRFPGFEGEIAINELMVRPTAALGQYVEVLNESSLPLNLRGLEVMNNTGYFRIEADLVIQPFAVVVIGASTDRTENGGVPVAWAWPRTFALQDEDMLVIGDFHDVVSWDLAGGYPIVPGQAMGVDPSDVGLVQMGLANDEAGAWCLQRELIGRGPDRGTPGLTNSLCRPTGACEPNPCNSPPPDLFCSANAIVRASTPGRCLEAPAGGYTCRYAETDLVFDCGQETLYCLDGGCVACRADEDCDAGTCDRTTGECGVSPRAIAMCRLQGPTSLLVAAGGKASVFARLHVPGLTDQDTTGNDGDPDGLIQFQAGFGRVGTVPDASWVWSPGVAHVDYVVGGNPDGEEPDFDEYVALMGVEADLGSYAFAGRFSSDGGETWLLCDLDGTAPRGTSPLDFNPLATGRLAVRDPREIRATLHMQSFDTLAQAVPSVTGFMERLTGWVLHNATGTGLISAGTGATGGIYSFGAANGAQSGDRALGGIASSSVGIQRWGFCWTNDSGVTWPDLRVTYRGEQWRVSSAAEAQSLAVDWTRSGTGNPVPDTFGVTALTSARASSPALGWYRSPELSFTSPVFGRPAEALDGNVRPHAVRVDHILAGANIRPGERVCFRWEDADDADTDHGLALDDFVLEGLRLP